MCGVLLWNSAIKVQMESTTPYRLESLVNPSPVELLQEENERLKRSVNNLIEAIADADQKIITIAGSIDEPDKILSVSKDLMRVLADTAHFFV